MIHQAYTEMLQFARIKERERVTRKSLKKKYLKKKETSKKHLLLIHEKWWQTGEVRQHSKQKKKALYRNFNDGDEDLVNILIHLQPSVEGKDFTSNLRDILAWK